MEDKGVLVALPVRKNHVDEVFHHCETSLFHQLDSSHVVRLFEAVLLAEFGEPTAVKPHDDVTAWEEWCALFKVFDVFVFAFCH